jgi:hypothetical protein
MKAITIYKAYYENTVGRISDDPMGFARLTYQPGPRQKEALHTLLGHVTRLLTQYSDGCLLVDQRLMDPFTPDEQVYVLEQWLPQAAQDGGYRYGAVVVAHNVFARLATAMVVTAARNLPMTYCYFDDEAEAVTWLLRQQRQLQ